MNDITLYHGSRGGISGEIKPISRPRCDFGKGFYMGDNLQQTQALVSGDSMPVSYTVKLDLSGIPKDRIIELDGLDWAYFVLYNRGKLDALKGTELYEYQKYIEENSDFIVGPIADDNMNIVINKFLNNEISDDALLACISCIDYGVQYVAKSEYACSCVDILSSEELAPYKCSELEIYTQARRKESFSLVQDIQSEFFGIGTKLSEIKKEWSKQPKTDIPTILENAKNQFKKELQEYSSSENFWENRFKWREREREYESFIKHLEMRQHIHEKLEEITHGEQNKEPTAVIYNIKPNIEDIEL